MSDPISSNNDPAPEKHKGDSSFLQVVIIAVIFLFIALIAALVLTKGRQNKLVPAPPDPHPTSQILHTKPAFDLA